MKALLIQQVCIVSILEIVAAMDLLVGVVTSVKRLAVNLAMVAAIIVKNPSVIETSEGDFIGIRHKMFLSHSYDHRVVDGALGGMFVRKVADYLEAFDVNSAL